MWLLSAVLRTASINVSAYSRGLSTCWRTSSWVLASQACCMVGLVTSLTRLSMSPAFDLPCHLTSMQLCGLACLSNQGSGQLD